MTIKEKLEFYQCRDEPVHIKIISKTNSLITKQFRNGKILKINSSSFILNDEKLGEILITFDELFSIDKREKKR